MVQEIRVQTYIGGSHKYTITIDPDKQIKDLIHEFCCAAELKEEDEQRISITFRGKECEVNCKIRDYNIPSNVYVTASFRRSGAPLPQINHSITAPVINHSIPSLVANSISVPEVNQPVPIPASEVNRSTTSSVNNGSILLPVINNSTPVPVFNQSIPSLDINHSISSVANQSFPASAVSDSVPMPVFNQSNSVPIISHSAPTFQVNHSIASSVSIPMGPGFAQPFPGHSNLTGNSTQALQVNHSISAPADNHSPSFSHLSLSKSKEENLESSLLTSVNRFPKSTESPTHSDLNPSIPAPAVDYSLPAVSNCSSPVTVHQNLEDQASERNRTVLRPSIFPGQGKKMENIRINIRTSGKSFEISLDSRNLTLSHLQNQIQSKTNIPMHLQIILLNGKHRLDTNPGRLDTMLIQGACLWVMMEGEQQSGSVPDVFYRDPPIDDTNIWVYCHEEHDTPIQKAKLLVYCKACFVEGFALCDEPSTWVEFEDKRGECFSSTCSPKQELGAFTNCGWYTQCCGEYLKKNCESSSLAARNNRLIGYLNNDNGIHECSITKGNPPALFQFSCGHKIGTTAFNENLLRKINENQLDGILVRNTSPNKILFGEHMLKCLVGQCNGALCFDTLRIFPGTYSRLKGSRIDFFQENFKAKGVIYCGLDTHKKPNFFQSDPNSPISCPHELCPECNVPVCKQCGKAWGTCGHSKTESISKFTAHLNAITNLLTTSVASRCPECRMLGDKINDNFNVCTKIMCQCRHEYCFMCEQRVLPYDNHYKKGRCFLYLKDFYEQFSKFFATEDEALEQFRKERRNAALKKYRRDNNIDDHLWGKLLDAIQQTHLIEIQENL